VGCWHKAVWQKGDVTVTGKWYYHWAADRFHIILDKEDEITGQRPEIWTTNDHPEFNGFKLVREEEKPRTKKKKTA
jgi:hypothetical protein